MIGMVLVTHGRLAIEFVAALEHVVGAQGQVAAVCIGPEDDMEQRRQEILRSIREGLVANRIAPDTHRDQAIGDELSIALAAVPPQRNVDARQGPRGFAEP